MAPEEAAKLTGRKSVLKTGIKKIRLEKKISVGHSDTSKSEFFFLNNICFKYPYANPLCVPKDSEFFF